MIIRKIFLITIFVLLNVHTSDAVGLCSGGIDIDCNGGNARWARCWHSCRNSHRWYKCPKYFIKKLADGTKYRGPRGGNVPGHAMCSGNARWRGCNLPADYLPALSTICTNNGDGVALQSEQNVMTAIRTARAERTRQNLEGIGLTAHQSYQGMLYLTMYSDVYILHAFIHEKPDINLCKSDVMEDYYDQDVLKELYEIEELEDELAALERMDLNELEHDAKDRNRLFGYN